ncbi:SET22 [Leishmania donovani]|uniref:SET domain family protein n=1 Tax=Leishmania donovani TaxID=5661 RepID=A0A504XZ50_LEIDO|nr:SET domain family protein [Leishmania donovani]CAJ1988971.1 SET22 [Leishmania donovani]VDZ44848.1 SET_domain_containing_protein_putative/Pfam:PF00856 [Leishmania donovani]
MDSCVSLTYSSKEEAGRHAVARRHLSPGELVLAAAPFGLVMNPNWCPSALHLSSKATARSDAATSASSADPGGTTARKAGGGHGCGNRANSAAAVSAAGESASASHYTHALEDEAGVQGEVSPTSLSRWYTTTPTWCSVCFQEIPAGRWLCNRGSLAELAMDIAQEQEELDRSIRVAEAQAPGSDEVNKSDEGGDDAASAAAAAALRKLKKPSKSSATRKKGAVELKQRLQEKALALREELLLRRRLQRRRRVEEGLPVVRREGWETPTSSSSFAAGAAYEEPAMSGCTGCGVLCFCSEVCWRAHRDEHEQSGECALLRSLYPRLMAAYYTMGVASSSASAGGASSTVVMPGDEPLHWARSTSEPRMLEFQSLLFSAIVVARVCRTGYQARCAATAEDAAVHSEGGVAAQVAAPSAGDGGSASVEARSQTNTLDEQLLPPTSPSALPGRGDQCSPDTLVASSTSMAVDSVVIPKEVWSINEIRAKAGLKGTVEVLDADPELRRIAREVLAPRDRSSAEGPPDGSSDSPAADPRVVRATTAARLRSCTSINTSRDGADDDPLPKLRARTPRYADLAQMETNLSVIAKHHRSTYQRYYRAFAKRVLPALQQLLLHQQRGVTVDGSDGDSRVDTASRPLAHLEKGTGDVLQVSEVYFQRLCAAAQCNSFGVYDTQDHCIGFGMYPEASYFNHSCVPNLCRVMHHGGRIAAFYALRAIAPQEPLTICYTDVEQLNSAERRRNLLGTYRFFCMCERCSGKAEGPQIAIAAAGNRESVSGPRSGCVEVSPAAFENPLLLCAECSIHGYLRPLPPPFFSSSPVKSDSAPKSTPSWTMQEVEMRQCTVCRSRVVREAVAAAATLQ